VLANEIISAAVLVRAGLEALSAIVRVVGERASRRFIEFFYCGDRNRNTRLAYARARRWPKERVSSNCCGMAAGFLVTVSPPSTPSPVFTFIKAGTSRCAAISPRQTSGAAIISMGIL
jgi:hypothetical protein